MDYYMSTHIPLVAKHWTPAGLKGWKVVKYNDDSPYCVGATLEWESLDKFQAAAGGDKAGEIMGDIPNFSDKQPALMPGEDIGSS